jgi:ubiquinone/menaquinone biosynthesis C-methylase UbiE
VGGVPRFLPGALPEDIKRTQATFSYEWKMFRSGERNWGQDISFRRDQFVRGLGVDPSDLRGKLMFDAGCGSGALSIELSKSLGMEIVALDLAFGIENAYRRNDSPFVYFVQGSVLEPPVQSNAFDYLYCAGVLVALPDARTGFKAIVRTLKRGGRCFIWVYHPINPAYYPGTWRKMALYNWIRTNVTLKLPIRLQYYLYLSWIPAFLAKQFVEGLLGRSRRPNPLTWREKMQAFFDFYSPAYQHRFEPSEVMTWYQQEGFSNAEVAYRETDGFAARGTLDKKDNYASISDVVETEDMAVRRA